MFTQFEQQKLHFIPFTIVFPLWKWGNFIPVVQRESRESKNVAERVKTQNEPRWICWSVHSIRSRETANLWIGLVPFQQIKQQFWGLTFAACSLFKCSPNVAIVMFMLLLWRRSWLLPDSFYVEKCMHQKTKKPDIWYSDTALWIWVLRNTISNLERVMRTLVLYLLHSGRTKRHINISNMNVSRCYYIQILFVPLLAETHLHQHISIDALKAWHFVHIQF